MIVKALYGWLTRFSIADVISQTNTILASMAEAKADYPTPVPALGVVEAARDAVVLAMNEAADGSREKNAIKRVKLAELVTDVRQLATYVTLTANGDLPTLMRSGFPHQKPTRSPVGELPPPSTPVVRQSKISGKILVDTPPVYGASSYNWRLALASEPGKYLQTIQTIGGRATFSGLIPGELYNVEANAVGAAGPSNWSTAGQLRVV